MAFDPNKDYMEEMRRMAAAGDEAGFDAAQTSRNEKITTNGINTPTTNYKMSDFASANGIATVPAINPNPAPGVPYNANVNYTQQRLNDEYNGNPAGAMANERLHNIKDGDLNLGWGATNFYNYQDYAGLGGLREAKYNEIEDYFRTPFSYNYLADPTYQSILKGKQNLGDKTYQDMLAQYSTAFNGDIPVNMLNKAATTKGEIIDQADNYIPTLRQMAENMYLNKGDQLIKQYNMLDKQYQDDRNYWLADREFYGKGVLDAYGNRINQDKTDWERLVDMASWYYNDDETLDVDDAMRKALARSYQN